MSALSQQYDAAQYHLTQINSNIATTKANIAADQTAGREGQDHPVQGGRRQLHLRRNGGRAEPDLQRQRADARRDHRVQQDRRGRHLARRRQPAHGRELAERPGGPTPGRADAGAGAGDGRTERRGAERAGRPAAEERPGPGTGPDRPAGPAAAAGRGRRRRQGRRSSARRPPPPRPLAAAAAARAPRWPGRSAASSASLAGSARPHRRRPPPAAPGRAGGREPDRRPLRLGRRVPQGLRPARVRLLGSDGLVVGPGRGRPAALLGRPDGRLDARPDQRPAAGRPPLLRPRRLGSRRHVRRRRPDDRGALHRGLGLVTGLRLGGGFAGAGRP